MEITTVPTLALFREIRELCVQLKGKYLVVIKTQKVSYSHYYPLLQNQCWPQPIPTPTFSKQKSKTYFLQSIPFFVITTNTFNEESNLSSFSFRDIFLLSASESFRVTSLETASSLFCATLEGKEKMFPRAPGVNITISQEHPVLIFCIGNCVILYISKK